MGQDTNPLIHKCFEKVMTPEEYVKEYNAKYNASEEWPSINWRSWDGNEDSIDADDPIVDGFDGSSVLHRINRINMIRRIIDNLHNMEPPVAIDCENVQHAIEYDPNTDLEEEVLIHEAFQEQRVVQRVEGVDGNDMDTNILLKKTTESLKVLCNIGLATSMKASRVGRKQTKH